MTDKKPLTLNLNLIQDLALDKKGKEIKDREGNKSYRRDDFIGLLNLLNRFDSRIHEMKDYKTFLQLKDKLYQNWSKDNKTLELTIDQASFLKTFLSEFTAKEGKDAPLQEFEMRTLVGILEQFTS